MHARVTPLCDSSNLHYFMQSLVVSSWYHLVETWDVFYSVCSIKNYHWQRMSTITKIWGLQLINSLQSLTLLIVMPPSTLHIRSIYLILLLWLSYCCALTCTNSGSMLAQLLFYFKFLCCMCWSCTQIIIIKLSIKIAYYMYKVLVMLSTRLWDLIIYNF